MKKTTLILLTGVAFAGIAASRLAAASLTAAGGGTERAVASYSSAVKNFTAARGAASVCENGAKIRFVSRGAFLQIR